MMRFLPNSFRMRLILLLAGAIILSEIIAIAIVVGDRGLAEMFAFDSRIVGQTTTAYGLASDDPSGPGTGPLLRLSSREQQFVVQTNKPALEAEWLRVDERLGASLATSLSEAGHGDVEVIAGSLTGPPPPWLLLRTARDILGRRGPDGADPGPGPLMQAPWADAPPDGASPRLQPLAGGEGGRVLKPGGPMEMRNRDQGEWGYLLAARLPNDTWLVSMARRPPSIWPLLQRASLAALIIAAVVLGIAAVIAGLIVRPINRLTAALSGFGRGETQQAMPPEGPEDVRAAISAFNTMSSNVSRTIASQRQMLAAVGHDLGSPLTALRLKTEDVADPELKQRMIEIIEEMQTLTQDVLTLARQATPQEDSRTVDLAALVDSLCQDLQDMGADVRFEPPGAVLWKGRINSLKRALRNLIENAFQYGGVARVELRHDGAVAIVTIDDDGPGIPADRLHDVMQPFTRLEESRSRRTGGSGLGLPIAQTIVDSLGGKLTLANREGGGLRATVELPIAA